MAYVITEDCIICGTCWEICPTKSIVEFDWYYKITDACVECGACARVCPNSAITRGKEKKAKEGKQKEA
jgi:NAD-dependent dihydropyrimidine dehydrogenase PreA subunit